MSVKRILLTITLTMGLGVVCEIAVKTIATGGPLVYWCATIALFIATLRWALLRLC